MRIRFILLGSVAILLAGCAGVFTGFDTVVNPVSDAAVEETIQYFDTGFLGPRYNVMVTLPDAWVDTFEIRNEGNRLTFEYINEKSGANPIFYVEALSESQYWEQIGSYPGIYKNLGNTNDTYFIYYAPIDAFYSGLSRALHAELLAELPGIAATFDIDLIDRPI